MKIKVGNKVYDSAEEPIMVILADQDKINIINMHPDCTKYVQYPSLEYSVEDIEIWVSKEG